MTVGELVGAGDESIASDLLDEAVYAAGPGWKADPQDGTDIEFARTLQDSVGHYAQRVHCLGDRKSTRLNSSH